MSGVLTFYSEIEHINKTDWKTVTSLRFQLPEERYPSEASMKTADPTNYSQLHCRNVGIYMSGITPFNWDNESR